MQYEIRAMSFGEVLDTAFQLVKNHFTLLVGIALAVTLPTALLTDAAAKLTEGGGLTAAASLIGFGLFVIVVSPIISAASTYAIGEVYLGRPVSFAEALKVGLKLLLRLVGTALLMALMVMGGLILLIIPGLYLLLAYMLTYQVLVIEDTGGWKALERCRQLSKGNLLRILGIYLVAMIVMVVASTGFALVGAQIPYLGTLLNAVVQAVGSAFMSAALVVLYFDIRCRKEAFDLEHLAQLVSGDGQPGASAI